MPDPMDELEHFTTPGLTMTPLSASEVRRRGTRMRRRNNALATLGGVAAAAIIATPLALAATGDDADRTPPPATQPADGWKQQIPADFDIAALPAGAGFTFDAQGDPAIDQVQLCDETVFDTTVDDQVSGTAGATTEADANTDGGTGRTLALYADDDAAQAALDRIRQGVADCPVEEQPPGLPLVNDALDGAVPGAEDSFVWTNQAKDGDSLSDLTVFEAARVGNALYLSFSHSAAGGEQVVGINAPLLLDQSAPVIDQMCTFSAQGCAPTQPDSTEGVEEPTGLTGTIPGSFPLEKGLPTDPQGGVGVEGPSHDLDLAAYNLDNNLQACGVGPTDLPEATDTLYAGFRSPATGILRQLMTFESVADAETYAENLMAPFAACPEDADNRGVTKVYEVVGEDAGDQASSAVMRIEVEGEPGPGFQVVQVVRVGQAVLQTLVVSEEEPSQPVDVLRTMYLENSQSVIDEMN